MYPEVDCPTEPGYYWTSNPSAPEPVIVKVEKPLAFYRNLEPVNKLQFSFKAKNTYDIDDCHHWRWFGPVQVPEGLL